ncbi:hypothetical protein G4Y79_23830 [Phototrophicus methaneseepsis]|uniref:Transcriptional regulator n=1 Tax=Phototrophicus methaneseepsis TaxID=2710758 RepID=A0A7S8IEK7_9CHLR|nr:hypothetical protein [Phototrophicus methaneseepsis]QPC82677.1 hypothetical protein G4Y79_23830 [Phototrophicus methaneseepsis]
MAEDQSFRSNYMEGINKFQGLRSRAFWQDMLALFRGKSAELLSFEEIRQRLRLREESYRGLQDIPVDKIVGSVGRYNDFSRTFLPKSNDMRERWSRVYATMNSMQGVPPIEVFKVGDAYFVRDGNHRVSVARQIGSKTIQAHVTELPSAFHLEPGMTMADVEQAANYIAFLEETGLPQTRPNHINMQLSEPSRYPEMLGHIYLHAQVLERTRGEPVSMEEAAANWYDNVFRPAITLIRKYNVLTESGEENKRTEGDLYLWMVDHLRDVRRQYGAEAETRKFSHALIDYLTEKKLAIPRDLLDENDNSVILSRAQVMAAIQQATTNSDAQSDHEDDEAADRTAGPINEPQDEGDYEHASEATSEDDYSDDIAAQ